MPEVTGVPGREGETSLIPREHRRTLLLIFCTAFCLYGLTMKGVLSQDEEMFYLVAESLGNRGEVAVRDSVFSADASFVGKDGRRYAYFDIGQSLVALPLQQIAHRLSGAFPEGLRPFIERFAVAGVGPIAGALTLVLTFLLALHSGVSRRGALWLVLLLAIASPLWFYSRTLFRAPVLAVALTALALFTCRAFEGNRPRDWWLAGCSLAAAILLKAPTLLVGVPLLALFFWRAPRPGRLHAFVAVSLPVVCAVGVFFFYQYVRFGLGEAKVGGFEGPYFTTPLLEGIRGVLFSPGRGLFLYCPLVFGVVWFGRDLIARVKSEAALRRFHVPILASLTLVTLLVHAKWKWWTGGMCWGPRFLVPVLPALGILIALAIEARPGPLLRSRGGRPCVAAVIAFSIFVQFVGVTTEGRHLTHDPVSPEYFQSVYNPDWSTPLSPRLWAAPFEARFTPMPQEVSRTAIQGDGYTTILRESWAFWWVYLYRVGLPPLFLLPAVLLALGFVAGSVALWRDGRRRTRCEPKERSPLIEKARGAI